MNFNTIFLKSFRILLFPLALLYGMVVWMRNRLFDKGILRSTSFNIPLICVGNLAVGGTGKSPMVEYLVSLLKERFNVATLSRGYKRRTKGYILANDYSTALDIGDEPMQFHLKFPDIPVAVGEERIVAIPQLLYDRPQTDVIVLDDAFQHRSIEAGLNILLTDYSNLYTRDFYLPTGDLRDERASSKRADIIIVTKCRPELSEAYRKKIIKEIEPLPRQHIFFSSIIYGQPYHITTGHRRSLSKNTEVLLVCGIANPEPLTRQLLIESKTYDALFYDDHHIFTIDDLNDMMKRFEKISTHDKIILTTEKDAVRLVKFENELADFPFYVLPIGMSFLFGDTNRFNDLIINFIRNFKQNNKQTAGTA
jgi:tetraacyldisaccharide 4'-kinase